MRTNREFNNRSSSEDKIMMLSNTWAKSIKNKMKIYKMLELASS
jgi:hypothetical protein